MTTNGRPDRLVTDQYRANTESSEAPDKARLFEQISPPMFQISK
ncbi:hypothetical protein LCAUW1_2863 [Lacticaseibacillus paracasei]|nr:hypothetical protein LCAUW1_2863 [Lacticaseibacillus paracasei]